MKITRARLVQIINEEVTKLREELSEGDPLDAVNAWLNDAKPTTDVSRKKTASELAKKLASGEKGRADIDMALRATRKDVHAKNDHARQEKLNALTSALEDPETTAGFSTSGATRSKLPPMV